MCMNDNELSLSFAVNDMNLQEMKDTNTVCHAHQT